MLSLHVVLFYTGIDLDDIMQIDCLAYKYCVFNRFSLVGYNIDIVKYVIIGVPPKSAQFASIRNQNVYK